jgi:6-pyruvoyltetrahydropterin/6-carboxytetrahydropterin synthase
LPIKEQGDYYHADFNNETIIFLKRDVKLLPLTNVTVEELSNWLLQQVIADKQELKTNNVKKVVIKVLSGPGQSGSSTWELGNE